jgi:SAM-dependent methyltransferase
VVKKYQRGGQIFDIGGGNGIVSKELQRIGMEVYLIEPGFDGALNARNSGIDNVICSSLEDSGFKQNTIPTAGLFDILEHCEDDTAFLKMLHSLIIPRGRLYLTVPAHRFLWAENDIQVGHMRRYSKDELFQKLESIGFVVDYATYYFSFLLIPMYLLRSLPYQFGIRKKVTPETKRKEHMVNRELLKRFIDWFLKRELKHIRHGKSIKFGSSCLFVASKT